MDAPARPETTAPLTHAQIMTILIGVVLAMLLGALDQTIIVTALPTIGRELNDFQNLSWVVTAYLLTATAVTPLYGKLSDVYGRRSMIMIAIAVFIAGSVASALSPNMMSLIVSRAVQGLGGGGLMSLGMTIIGDVISPRERGRYQAFFASIFVTSSIAGPIIGGFFAEYLHWSFIFWINLPLGLAAYLLTARVLRLLPRHERPRRIDYLGALLMVAATVALLLVITAGGVNYAWDSPQILGVAVISAVFWVAFAARLLTAPEPFIPLDVLANSIVRYGVLSSFFGFSALIGLSVYVPLYFEAVLGLTAAQSGLALIVLMGGSVGGAMMTGRVMVKFDRYKWAPVTGLSLSTAACAVLAIWPTTFSLWTVEAVFLVLGVGLGTMFPTTTTCVQNAVPLHQMGTATSVLNFFRSLGGALLTAVLGAIIVAVATSATDDLVSVQTVILEGQRNGMDFAAVFRWVFGAATLALLLSTLSIAAMEERPLRSHAAH